MVVVGYVCSEKDDDRSHNFVNEKTLTETSSSECHFSDAGKAAGADIQSNVRPGETSRCDSWVIVQDPLSPTLCSRWRSANGRCKRHKPGDIESIEILKDASSTAIYGSRELMVIVLVTTKSGKSGKVPG